MSSHINPPRMRISRRIKKDQIFKIKVKFDHLSFPGLGLVDDKTLPMFNRATPVSFIRNMLVYYGDDLVSRFRMSATIADSPLITFKMKAIKEAPLKVVFIDNNGERWEITKKIKFRK